jgi:polyisoprenoid-binding protein YceI
MQRNANAINTSTAAGLATGTWRLDRSRSSVEFSAPSFWGLVTVKGGFGSYEGTLDLSRRPAVSLVIEGDSLDTGHKRRDKHLSSADFFDFANHPRVRFEADAAELDGDTLKVRGLLYAAGRHVPLDVDATVSQDGDEFEIEATTVVDHRELGMTWGKAMVGTPSTLTVRGRLVAEDA